MNFIRKIGREIHDWWRLFLHILAIYCPNSRLKRMFYRLRGTKIGKRVDISMLAFIEESYPHLIDIKDGVDIGPGVIIVTHDSSYHNIKPEIPILLGKVTIEKNVYIGAGAIILPGVTIEKDPSWLLAQL